MLGRVWLALALGVAGCAGAPGEGATVSTTGSSTSTTSVMTSEDASSTSSTSSTGSTTIDPSSTGETSMGCVFLCGPDLGVDDCDPWLQDCPEGEKCSAWAKDGGAAWNANKCVPVDPDPDALGEACTVVESPYSGIDSCDHGAMCWDVDPKTLTGRCVALCDGSLEQCTENAASCCPPGLACVQTRVLTLCLSTCHPLLQNCEGGGDVCYPVASSFICAPDDSGDAGQAGDPCEYINVCDPGTYCGEPTAYPGCDPRVGGCCTPFCDLNAPDCVMGTECLPWYDPMDAPPSHADLGSCVIP